MKRMVIPRKSMPLVFALSVLLFGCTCQMVRFVTNTTEPTPPETVDHFSKNGLEQPPYVRIDDDLIIGLNFVNLSGRFGQDGETEAVVLIGEIEEEAAKHSWKKAQKILVS